MTNQDDKWIEIFFERFFDENIADNDLEKCLIFKNEHIPEKLYQYTKAKYAKTLLCDNLMYLRNIGDLNDPFEGDLLVNLKNIYINMTYDEYLKLNKDKMEAIEKQIKINEKKLLEEGWENYKRTINIACFSEKNDINPMWTHYGDDHEGICIQYNFKENKNFKDQCMPINYINNTNNDTVIEKIQRGGFVKNRLIWEVFLKKSEDWGYEKEWRLIYDKQVPKKITTIFCDNANKKYIPFLKPEAVYLGLRIKEEDRRSIIDMCNFNNIKIYQMNKDNSNYNLKSIDI